MDEKTKANFLLFGSQIIILFVVIVASLVNLTLQCGNQQLWMIVLTCCLGYILPNPKLKIDKEIDNEVIKRTQSL